MAEGTVGNWYGHLGSREWRDRVDDLPDDVLSASDAAVNGDDPPSSGYDREAEGREAGLTCGEIDARERTRRIAQCRLLAVTAGATAATISAVGVITMSILPELVKSLGTEGAIVVVGVFLLGGGAWSYYFMRLVLELWKQYTKSVELMRQEQHIDSEQMRKEQRADAKAYAREVKEAFREGYLTGYEQAQLGGDERAPAQESWKRRNE